MTTRPGVALRPARADDWDAIWPIWREIVTAGETYAYDPDSTSEQARSGWLATPPDECWVAEVDGTLLATYRLGPNRPGRGSHVGTASYMVAAAARGRGVGRAMVEHSIDRARRRGFLGVQFNAVTETNVHAVRLYRQLGFDVVGTVPRAFRHPTEGLVGLHVMYLELGT